MDKDIKKISRIFRRYRWYYRITDFILLFILFYTLSFYFNVVTVFSQYMEFYVIGTITLDKIIVVGLCGLISVVLVILLYIRKPPVDPFQMIESRYGWMIERLQTAWDNRYEDNIVASDLIEQVTNRLKQVNIGSFLNRKHLVTRLLFSMILAASLIGLSTTQTHSDFTPQDIAQIIETTADNLSNSALPNQTSKESGTDDDIYGETSVASLSGENIELLIIPGLGTEVTIRHTEQEDDIQFVASQTYPVYNINASAAADESYQAILALSDQDSDLVKEYAILRSKL
jgi:hypothetical protein